VCPARLGYWVHFGAKESLDGRPAAPVEVVGTESETGADVDGRSAKQVGGGRPGGYVAGSLGGPPPKKFFPNFPKILGVEASFSSALYGDPQGPSGIQFRQLYLGLLPRKKIPKF